MRHGYVLGDYLLAKFCTPASAEICNHISRAFNCMKHVVAETNRCNISAVAAALHSYIRMTIEKI
eukprot:9612911-Prorocentrum_lima.AAC.1